MNVPVLNPTGASVVCTVDNSPTNGTVSVLVSGGGLPTQQTYIA